MAPLLGYLVEQVCTEMVMLMSCSNQSMFPSYENDYEAFEEQCMSRYGAKPRPHWITTEFGGKVKLLLCLLSLDHNWISSSFNNELIGYVFVENIVSVEEIWKQHHILQWNARFVEPWRIKEKNEKQHYLHEHMCSPCRSKGSYKRRSGVAERAEEARGGHCREMDQ
ncbi:hypothetical protein YC2023_106763 [Brassica napus]